MSCRTVALLQVTECTMPLEKIKEFLTTYVFNEVRIAIWTMLLERNSKMKEVKNEAWAWLELEIFETNNGTDWSVGNVSH